MGKARKSEEENRGGENRGGEEKFPPVFFFFFSCSPFLNSAVPTISEPGIGYT